MSIQIVQSSRPAMWQLLQIWFMIWIGIVGILSWKKLVNGARKSSWTCDWFIVGMKKSVYKNVRYGDAHPKDMAKLLWNLIRLKFLFVFQSALILYFPLQWPISQFLSYYIHIIFDTWLWLQQLTVTSTRIPKSPNLCCINVSM